MSDPTNTGPEESIGYQAGPAQQAAMERALNVLRDKLRNLDRQLAAATSNNSRLVTMLETAKTEILKLRTALENEGQAPFSFGTLVQINPR
jgi:proteasome-associated ATPase